MSTRQLERPVASARQGDAATVVKRFASVFVGVWHLFESAWRALDRPERSAPIEPYVIGQTKLFRKLLVPSLLGFVATSAICIGATQPNSPFTLKVPGAWFFGIPAPSLVQGQTPIPGQGLFFGVVAVYGGMALLFRAWLDIVRITTRHPGIPTRLLVPVFAAWVAPLLLVAPLFSRDVYSYAAQGEMMTHGINPYHYGPGLLGATPFSNLVDPLWQNVSSPYGPVFLGLAGLVVTAASHHVLVEIEGMRLLALAGTAMFAAAVPSIARSFGRDGATAFSLAALNPLILLHLIGGAHNDALMLGLLVSGYALARRGHPILGIICCAVAAEVKVPAIVGAVYIGWQWLGSDKTVRERLRPVTTALVIAFGVMAIVSEVVGLGWGWIGGLTNPDAVRSWLDPATGVAILVSKISGGLGFGAHTAILITLARGSAFACAGVLALVMLLRSEQMGVLRAFGWTLVVVVMLGPVVQPWYLSWGFVFLAPVAERRDKRILLGASVVACFLGLPGGRVLLNELAIANPAVVMLACVALVALLGVLVVPRYRSAEFRRAPRSLPLS